MKNMTASTIRTPWMRRQRLVMTISLLLLLDIQGLVMQQPSPLSPGTRTGGSLEGKRAFVTGSSGGIGAGIAKKLANEGAHVLLHYHIRKEGALETRKSILQNGGSCVGIVQCDFRSPAAIQDLFENVIDTQICWPQPTTKHQKDNDENDNDGIDILINNAGIVSKLALEDDTNDLNVWHETMQVNLHAPVQLSRLAHARMKKKKSGHGGVIVNVSSIHGTQSVEYMVAYAASKAALDSVTRGMAIEYAPDNVRVNAIAPGVVPVERSEEYFADPKNMDLWVPHLPTNRVGTIDEIADATIPLITNEWVTGTIWTIDGGMLARSNMPVRPRPAPSVSLDDANEIPKQARLL